MAYLFSHYRYERPRSGDLTIWQCLKDAWQVLKGEAAAMRYDIDPSLRRCPVCMELVQPDSMWREFAAGYECFRVHEYCAHRLYAARVEG